MNKLIRAIDSILATSLILAMSGILFAVIWQVISRYLLQDPASVTEELSRFFLIWIGILGAAYAYRKKAHLGFNLLVNRQPEQVQFWLHILIELCVMTFSVFALIVGGYQLVSLTLELEQVSAALNIKMGWVYSVLPLSGSLIVIYCIDNIVELASGKNQEAQTWS